LSVVGCGYINSVSQLELLLWFLIPEGITSNSF
jgi:hypothetical protein